MSWGEIDITIGGGESPSGGLSGSGGIDGGGGGTGESGLGWGYRIIEEVVLRDCSNITGGIHSTDIEGVVTLGGGESNGRGSDINSSGGVGSDGEGSTTSTGGGGDIGIAVPSISKSGETGEGILGGDGGLARIEGGGGIRTTNGKSIGDGGVSTEGKGLRRSGITYFITGADIEGGGGIEGDSILIRSGNGTIRASGIEIVGGGVAVF